MLKILKVKNYIIIDELDIEFSDGFNVITGETGAGKSIILGALRLVLGDRASADTIMRGREKALIQAVFEIDKAKAELFNDMFGLSIDDELILTREIGVNRSVAKINGEIVTLNQLKNLGEELIRIHGQNDNRELTNTLLQRNLLDDYMPKEIKSTLDRVAKLCNEYRELLNLKKEFGEGPSAIMRERALLEFQAEDIDKISPSKSDMDIDERFEKLQNARDIIESLNNANYILMGDDNRYSVYNSLKDVIRQINHVSKYAQELESDLERINEFLYDLKELSRNYEYMATDLESESQSFSEVSERFNHINLLKKKYGNTIEDVIKFREEVFDKILECDKKIEKIANLDVDIEKKMIEYFEIADILSKKRKEYAKLMSQAIEAVLVDLNFEHAKFEIVFEDKERDIAPKGYDNIEFQARLNAGGALNPIRKVASGGEVSRLMLAIQSAIADMEAKATVIFDEIDTGISGRTASAIAKRMYQVSKHHQIICITHLAQVAVYADEHFLIDKKVIDGESKSGLIRLDDDARANELARIMGGEHVSDDMLTNAKNMLSEVRASKQVKSNN